LLPVEPASRIPRADATSLRAAALQLFERL
jgi:hypothetical protein